jgi:lysine 2,3-aminomutase
MEGNCITLPFISTADGLSPFVNLGAEQKGVIERVSRKYPFRVTTHYGRLMEAGNVSCPIRLQAIPSSQELAGFGVPDPLGEKEIAATPVFFTRYHGRGVFLVSAECAMYCRFCNRRRLVGKGFDPRVYREETFAFLRENKEFREVILSGGDPLMLEPDELGYILGRLREIDHIKTIRISSRMPVVFPERVYGHLDSIGAFGPCWFVVHINHPREITPQFLEVIYRLREGGASIVSQTVLLRGVNDCPHILARLFERLVEAGAKPYYLFQLDDVVGATHFKVRLSRGFEIMADLRRRLSGLCLPYYALDITGGLGKIPLECGYVKEREGDRVFMENLNGERGEYLDNGEESECQQCGLCRT